MTKPKTLILTVGLPRSGKSTWAMAQGHPVVNPDAIRLGLHGKRHEPLAEGFVWATAKLMVRALFIAGHDTVILDATNITRGRRNEWASKDWVSAFQVFDTPPEVCVLRALDTHPDLVPVIHRMHKQFQPVEEWEAR